eukprot:45564-Rhodomonas_salina.3
MAGSTRPMALCIAYAMPGTDIACVAILSMGLRVRYAMPSTDIAHTAILCMGLRIACATPGTDMAHRCYGLDMQCPVLKESVWCYRGVEAESNADKYSGSWSAAIRLRACYAMSGTDMPYGAPGSGVQRTGLGSGRIGRAYLPTRLLRDVRCLRLSSYAPATRCPLLTYCIALPGAGRRCGAGTVALLWPYAAATVCYWAMPLLGSVRVRYCPKAVCGTELGYGATRPYPQPDEVTQKVRYPTTLPTTLPRYPTTLHEHATLPRYTTMLHYHATLPRCPITLPYHATLSRYAICLHVSCMLCTTRRVLRAVRYRGSLWFYALCGTDLAYGGTSGCS